MNFTFSVFFLIPFKFHNDDHFCLVLVVESPWSTNALKGFDEFISYVHPLRDTDNWEVMRDEEYPPLDLSLDDLVVPIPDVSIDFPLFDDMLELDMEFPPVMSPNDDNNNFTCNSSFSYSNDDDHNSTGNSSWSY